MTFKVVHPPPMSSNTVTTFLQRALSYAKIGSIAAWPASSYVARCFQRGGRRAESDGERTTSKAPGTARGRAVATTKPWRTHGGREIGR